jgi:hypothetical protein
LQRHVVAAGTIAAAARRTALMTSSPLVPVEGTLARPRAAPLDGVPPFGREWTFRGMSGARPGKRCLATLTTSCIDIVAPHRTCRWQPLPVAPPSSAGVPAAAPGATRRYIERAPGRTHDRRALRAACWSIGALAIIGWLVTAHEPFPDFAPKPTIQPAVPVPQHVAQSTGTVRVAALERAKPASAPAQHAAARPAAISAMPSPSARGAAPKAPPRRAGAASDGRRVATASPPRPSSSTHQPAGKRPTPAHAAAHVAARLDAGSSVTLHGSHASSHDHFDRPSHSLAPQRPLDDPLTLIAMAHALDAERPARPANVPAAGFDWTARLSHRRLTDTSDTLRR